ncbi:hypothetical protein B2K_39975 [Paenibacillus mucilaginosus K02]|uniref:Uncharacterized protein n=1 Tax=Paenibacillus mucilaginosus K02 TaxID=997761 RepID=R9UQ27_9BACL|nr:hypothetical protein B2K_39975 [Paenibacillus mucilaginosus K02]
MVLPDLKPEPASLRMQESLYECGGAGPFAGGVTAGQPE